MSKVIIKAELPWLHVDLQELFEFRWVFFMLILRDIKLRYKQTALGVVWVILQPLITALLFTVVFGKMIKIPSDGVPYTLFAFCGLVPWLVFSQSLQRGSMSLINDSPTIKKVYFPRVFLPLSSTFGVAIDFFISLFMVAILMGIYGHAPATNILFLPLATLLLFTFSVAMNLFLSSWNVFYRDFKHIIPFLVQLWMYASPLVYSGNMIPEKYRLIYSLNPVAGIIDTFRWTLLGLDTFPTYSFTVATICSLGLLIWGTIFFRKVEHYFADVI